MITMNRETSLRQAGTHVGDAIDAGADCLVTPCPLCHLNLDMQQPEAAKSSTAISASPSCTSRSWSAWPSAPAEGAGDEQAHRLDQVGPRALDRIFF